MKWFIKCFRQYTDFAGVASRTEFWMFFLFWNLGWLAIVFASAILGGIFTAIIGESAGGDVYMGVATLLLIAYSLGTLLPSLAVGARRLRDAGLSPWWLLLILTFYFAPILYILWCLPTKRQVEYSVAANGDAPDAVKGSTHEVVSEEVPLSDEVVGEVITVSPLTAAYKLFCEMETAYDKAPKSRRKRITKKYEDACYDYGVMCNLVACEALRMPVRDDSEFIFPDDHEEFEKNVELLNAWHLKVEEQGRTTQSDRREFLDMALPFFYRYKLMSEAGTAKEFFVGQLTKKNEQGLMMLRMEVDEEPIRELYAQLPGKDFEQQSLLGDVREKLETSFKEGKSPYGRDGDGTREMLNDYEELKAYFEDVQLIYNNTSMALQVARARAYRNLYLGFEVGYVLKQVDTNLMMVQDARWMEEAMPDFNLEGLNLDTQVLAASLKEGLNALVDSFNNNGFQSGNEKGWLGTVISIGVRVGVAAIEAATEQARQNSLLQSEIAKYVVQIINASDNMQGEIVRMVEITNRLRTMNKAFWQQYERVRAHVFDPSFNERCKADTEYKSKMLNAYRGLMESLNAYNMASKSTIH